MQTPLPGGNIADINYDVPFEHADAAAYSRIFDDWLQSLDPRFGVSAITIQAVDFRGKPSADTVMFVRLKVKTAKPFEQIVELRGGTVIMFVILICEGRKYVVFVKQPRLATGNYELVEMPAGMIDNGTFRGAAAKEIEQELGIVITDGELVDLTPPTGPVYLSCGLLDEKARVYCVERRVTRAELEAMQGKATGVAAEGESIALSIVPLDNLQAGITSDGKAYIALALYAIKKAIEDGP
jgi:ADP-sugar diphosphatase